MRSYGDTAHPPVDPSSLHVGAKPAFEMLVRCSRGRAIQIDQMSLSPRLREIQQAGQMLAQTSEIRERRIVALKRDVESGHYSIKSEQIAEKIVKDHLLDLFH